jgi:hypothetical protein
MQIHIQEILQTDPVQYTALWADIGVALIQRGMYQEALGIFGELAENEEVSEGKKPRRFIANHPTS